MFQSVLGQYTEPHIAPGGLVCTFHTVMAALLPSLCESVCAWGNGTCDWKVINKGRKDWNSDVKATLMFQHV